MGGSPGRDTALFGFLLISLVAVTGVGLSGFTEGENTGLGRGINQAGMLDYENGWWPEEGTNYLDGQNEWTVANINFNLGKMVTEFNFDHVRFHTDPTRFNTNAAYRANLNTLCGLADAFGLDVIVDFYGDWQAYGIANIPALWTLAANTLKLNANVVFELWNEPDLDYGSGYYNTEQATWQTLLQDCIDAIRATGATQKIIACYKSTIWANVTPHPARGAGSTVQALYDYPLVDPESNLYYQLHIYRENAIINQPEAYYAYTEAQWEDWFELCLINDAIADGYKFWFTEVGANSWHVGDDLARELSFFEAALHLLTTKVQPHTIWVWTVTAHMMHGIFTNDVWLPPPNGAGTLVQVPLASHIASLTNLMSMMRRR